MLLRDRWQPARKLVALQKGSQQGGEFSCTILRREDLQGRDWDEEVVSGVGQADTKEVRHDQQGWLISLFSYYCTVTGWPRVSIISTIS